MLLAMYAVGRSWRSASPGCSRKRCSAARRRRSSWNCRRYKMPSLRNVVYRMAERGWAFLARAGTVIFAVTIVDLGAGLLSALRRASRRRNRGPARRTCKAMPAGARRIRRSGKPRPPRRQPAPAIQLSWAGPANGSNRPSGRSAGIGGSAAAAIASFPAREVVMGVLGVIYQLGPEVDVGAEGDQNRLQRAAPRRPLGRHGRAGLQFTGGPVDHGVLRAVCPVRGDAGRDPPRNQQLALAGVHVRVHDGAGLRRRTR